MKKTTLKLRLDPESVRVLQDRELQEAAGGMSAFWKCSGSCRAPCETASCGELCPTDGCN